MAIAPKDTVIVPARFAWPEYQRFDAYICQPHRAFHNVSYCGFYTLNAIQPVVANIRSYHPDVLMTHENAQRLRDMGHHALGDLVSLVLNSGDRDEGKSNGIMLLSGPDDPDTVHLPHPITNDTVKEQTGRRIAWTQNHRYATLAQLASGISLTSQLHSPNSS
ncbi:hypothetical protein ACFV5G_27115 [Streptomyces sp. NPDC059766]|uniref:hypothetical protein n=1 Tax=Streptomyces sp. NPDC059766 TaxID=3346940 RepID=UPI003669330C